MRPGVPTTISTPLFNWICCGWYGDPPYRQHDFNPNAPPQTSKSENTYNHIKKEEKEMKK